MVPRGTIKVSIILPCACEVRWVKCPLVRTYGVLILPCACDVHQHSNSESTRNCGTYQNLTHHNLPVCMRGAILSMLHCIQCKIFHNPPVYVRDAIISLRFLDNIIRIIFGIVRVRWDNCPSFRFWTSLVNPPNVRVMY